MSTLIPGDDDGKVSAERIGVEGRAYHIALPTSHAMMMQNSAVIEQVIYFLQNGKFYASD